MADVASLLAKTSRTFALAIPLLPELLADEVGVAYLLFRVADTFEDARDWSREMRLRALSEFIDLLGRPDAARAVARARAWVQAPPCAHAGYNELLAETPAVLAHLAQMQRRRPRQVEIITAHVTRTAEGMAQVVSGGGSDGQLALTTVEALRRYCYIVAGIVGEMLTELFLADSEGGLKSVEETLRAHAATFGEGLQLVNILKDANDDEHDGRSYVPRGELSAVRRLARDDLAAATQYVSALQDAGAKRGVIAFTALPVQLAYATLDCVERRGAGAKVQRAEVAAMLFRLNDRLAHGARVFESST